MSRPILIFATTYFPLVGGAEVAMKEITDRLPGWDFHLVCARLRPELPTQEKIGNVTVHRCGIGRPVDKYLLPVLGVSRSFFLPRPEFVWSLMASYGGMAALAYTWLHPRVAFLLTLQEGDPLEHYTKRTGILTGLHKGIFKRADVVQSISHYLAGWSTRMGFQGAPNVVPNGVDIERFTVVGPPGEVRERVRAELGYSPTDRVVVTASRLSLKNGVDDLIRSMPSLPPEYRLMILGDGEDAAKLRALTSELSLTSRVKFMGSQGHDALPRLLRASDVFVRASLSEGLGNAFLEAMAVGLPIVGTPVGGIPDFLVDGQTGVFCQPRDPSSIAKAVLRIDREPGLRERLVRDGERLVRSSYEWEGIAASMRSLFQSMTGDAPRPARLEKIAS